MRKCVKGLSCGKTCISRNVRCWDNVAQKSSIILDKITGAIERAKPDTYGRSLGQGEMGEVFETPTGTAYKVFQFRSGPYDDREVINAKLAGELGIGPKILSVTRRDGKLFGYEMEMLKGHSTLSKLPDGASIGTRIAVGDKLSSSLLSNMAKLHLANIAHNDLHNENIMVEGNKAKFIDFGLATKGQPKDIAYDLGDAFGESAAIYGYSPKNSFSPGTKDHKIMGLMLKTARASDKLYDKLSGESEITYDNAIENLIMGYRDRLKKIQ